MAVPNGSEDYRLAGHSPRVPAQWTGDNALDDYSDDVHGIGDLASARVESGPSLPIVLVGAAAGLASAVIGFYVTYIVLDLSAPMSAAVATLFLCGAVGASGAVLSALAGSRATTANIGLSCGLITVTLLFFGFCTLVGALTAALVLNAGG